MPDLDFITVSRSPERVKTLQRSIAMCLGTSIKFNLTVIDGNRYDRFTGYNVGASRTSGEFLIFIHDDAQLLGNALVFGGPLQLLRKPETGFIGVAGSKILTIDGTWWGGDLTTEQTFQNCRGMIMHPGGQNEFGIHALVWPGMSAEFGRVLVLNGVMLMCHRRTFQQLHGFDASTYKGFHFYEVDITYRAHQLGLKNYAAPMPLLHASPGEYGDAWETNRKIFAARFQTSLPAAI